MTKKIHITRSATFSIPDDAHWDEETKILHLADGNFLKPFLVLELNESDDQTTTQLEKMGIFDETE